RKDAAPLRIFISSPTAKVQHLRAAAAPERLDMSVVSTHLDILGLKMQVVDRIKLHAAIQFRQSQVEDELVTPPAILALIHPRRGLCPTADQPFKFEKSRAVTRKQTIVDYQRGLHLAVAPPENS